MTRLGAGDGPEVRAEAIEAWLRGRYGGGVERVGLTPLGASTQVALKDYGYGKPLRIRYRRGEEAGDLVLRTMSPDPFGHDRRADRVGALTQDRDTFVRMPCHIQPLAVGTFGADGALVEEGGGEPWLITDYVEGALYAEDLGALQGAEAAPARDVARARALARYLARVHAERAPEGAWERAIRDTIGSGEGIFGLCDSYPRDHGVATPARLEAIERACVGWRWRLRGHAGRARRTHGDFHPFNVLFREGEDFSVLDCSRGAVGEPADDVTCMSINYVFFALSGGQARFDGALRALWDGFWEAYLEASGDAQVLEHVALFFAWRGLVIASPVWYPRVADGVRERVLALIERLLGGERFAPERIDALLA